jgi:methionyl-tRNA synthetase
MSETNTVKFNEWQKLDLRVGKILKAEDIEGADKLYRLSIDLGKELGKRTLVAGIKPYYKKEELKDKSCIVFANLEPRTLRGIESQGMILASVSSDETHVRLLQPDKDIEVGSKVR